MKVYCSASQTVLNEFNRILRQENEEPNVSDLRLAIGRVICSRLGIEV